MFILFTVYFIMVLVIKTILYGQMITKLVKYETNDLDSIRYYLIKALNLKETIKNSNQDNKCPNWDLNQALSEHKTRQTPLHQPT